MRLITFQGGRAADTGFRYVMAIVGDPLFRAELIHVLQEMRSGGGRIRTEEVPVKTQRCHQASFSLSNRISIIGAMRSYSMRYVAALIGMSTPSLLLISCTHFTA